MAPPPIDPTLGPDVAVEPTATVVIPGLSEAAVREAAVTLSFYDWSPGEFVLSTTDPRLRPVAPERFASDPALRFGMRRGPNGEVLGPVNVKEVGQYGVRQK